MRKKKLTISQRRVMIHRWVHGESSTKLGREFGVHPAYVRKAACRAGFRRRP